MKAQRIRIMNIHFSGQHFGYISNLAVIVVRFCTAVMFFVVGIQGTEMYPTCLRQTGFALCAIASNIASAIGPYIAYVVSGKKN